MNIVRSRIDWMMIWILVVAIHVPLGRYLLGSEAWSKETLSVTGGVMLVWGLITSGVVRVYLERKIQRVYWIGFLVGASATTFVGLSNPTYMWRFAR